MKKFNPLTFLASLGAGGLAVAPFGYFQYVIPHEKGLVTVAQIMKAAASSGQMALFYALMAVMVVFTAIHLVLTYVFISDFISWRKTADYKEYINDPMRNSGMLAMFTSLAMTFNVFIGVFRFFMPILSSNFQALMLPALVVWAVLWILLMRTEIKLLKISFEKDFDVAKISFGWLQHPFALGMVTVAGTGIAALANDSAIAHTAAFLSLTSGSMGMFLFMVKLISIFKSHFSIKGLPERQFLPSFLIVVPITTIYAISIFRMGHFFEHWYGFHAAPFSVAAIIIPFAFQTWYLGFGIAMLKDYFKKDFFRKEYYVSLWALICPFVGYAMLATFVFKFFAPSMLVQVVYASGMITAIVLYIVVASRYFKYEKAPVAIK